MNILVTDALSTEGLDFLAQQPDIHLVHRTGLSPDELVDAVEEADGLIVRSKTKVTAEVLAAAKRLRVIGRAGAGVDNIDLEAATRRGVLVMNTPGGNSVSAAEHAFALMISLARRIPSADKALHDGRWDKSEFIGQELKGKTLGLLGLGKIGSVLARLASGFSMNILAYDPFVSEPYAKDVGVQLCAMDEVLRAADVVSLHLPLTDQTRRLINSEKLALMKPGGLIINAARGGLIDEQDLARALEDGTIAGAGLDVFEHEPDIPDALRNSGRAVLTPHIAGSTVEAQAKVGGVIAEQVIDYLRDETIRNTVNFPAVAPALLEQVGPFLRLGEKLGALVAQLSEMRVSELGVRYYGDLTDLDCRPITNFVTKSVLRPGLSEKVNEVNARSLAAERGISVIESSSSRHRGHSNLISVQLRSANRKEWVEGAILHGGRLWLVSMDGMPIEAPLGSNLLVVRNDDTPGVIGQVGTILGKHGINIASFVLGREDAQPHAIGVVNTDNSVPAEVVGEIERIPAVQFVRVIKLG